MSKLKLNEFEKLCLPHLSRLRALYSNFSIDCYELEDNSFIIIVYNIMKEFPNNKLKYAYDYLDNKATLTVTSDGVNYKTLFESMQEKTQPTNHFITSTLYYGISNTLDKIKYPWLKDARR